MICPICKNKLKITKYENVASLICERHCQFILDAEDKIILYRISFPKEELTGILNSNVTRLHHSSNLNLLIKVKFIPLDIKDIYNEVHKLYEKLTKLKIFI